MVDSSKYRHMFISETRDKIGEINDLLPSCEKERSDPETLNTLFRAFHSIKGMAASMGYRETQEVSHKLEDLLEGLRSSTLKQCKEVVDILFEGTSLIEELVQSIDEHSSEKATTAPFKERLMAAISPIENHPPGKKYPHPMKEAPYPSVELSQEELDTISSAGRDYYKVNIVISNECISPQARAYLLVEVFREKKFVFVSRPSLEEIERGEIERSLSIYTGTSHDEESIMAILRSSVELEKFDIQKVKVVKGGRADDAGQLITREKKPPKTRPDIRYRRPDAVKVETRTLNRLIDIVGEMFVRQNQLMDIAGSVDIPEISESVSMLEKQVRKLHKEVVTLRMIPVSMLSDMIPRVIREVIKDSGKKIDIHVSGKEIELDRSIVEKLGDPVIHLIRNCVDHGIELPEERSALGKPETGRVSFRASRERDSITIELSDDGRGLDPEKIRGKILEKGFASEKTLMDKTDNEIFNYVWMPGFSTATTVTSVSGRGVGMDIVKSVIEGLGGKITLSSQKGAGCSFHIQVPLTIAIIKTFRIVLNQELFSVPMAKVLCTLSLSREEIVEEEKGSFFHYREEKIPLFTLKRVLKMSPSDSSDFPVQILVLDSGSKPLGFIIDSFVAGYETVIKPLGPPLEKISTFSGASLSEKGEVILILDADRIIAMALEQPPILNFLKND